MNLYKLTILNCLGICLLTANSSFSANRIAAVVNDEVITFADIENDINPIIERIGSRYDQNQLIEVKQRLRLKRRAELIENKLLLQEAKKNNITVTADEVQKEMKILIKKAGDIDRFEEFLQQIGSDLRMERNKIEEGLMLEKLLDEKVRNGVFVYIRPPLIKKFYQDNTHLFAQDRKVKIRNLLISFAAHPTKKEAVDLADKVSKMIKDGLSFQDAIKQNSEGQFKDQGGVFDFFGKGTYFDELESIAFELKKNEISKPFESPIGIHIIQLVDEKGGTPIPLATARNEITNRLYQRESARLTKEYIQKLIKKSHIVTHDSDDSR